MARVLGDSFGAIGDFKHSMLTVAQFQAQYGTGWVPTDGSSCTGTKYAAITGNTTVPNFLGMYLRGANANNGSGSGQNPDGTLLGGTQGDQFGSHAHGGGNHAHGMNGGGTPIVNGGSNNAAVTRTGNAFDFSGGIANSGAIIGSEGGNETRPRSGTVNIFIRVN